MGGEFHNGSETLTFGCCPPAPPRSPGSSLTGAEVGEGLPGSRQPHESLQCVQRTAGITKA